MRIEFNHEHAEWSAFATVGNVLVRGSGATVEAALAMALNMLEEEHHDAPGVVPVITKRVP